jgi:hypothetical protein
MRLLIDLETGNNNSLTTDSVISAVTNSITFKAAATESRDGFVLAPMAAFGTHKTIVDLHDDDRSASGEHVSAADEALAPLSGKEIQVHESCYNSSGVAGERLLPDICRKDTELLEDKRVNVSIAVNNSKAYLERISHALVSNSFNSLCDLFCWEHGTRYMSMDEELDFFHSRCLLVLDLLVVTRDNYAQTANFCQCPPRGLPFVCAPEMKLISHKFKNKRTDTLFRRSEPRYKELMERVSKYNVKKPLTLFCGCGKDEKYKKAVLHTRSPRTDSIVRRYELGPSVFRDGFPLKEPMKAEL